MDRRWHPDEDALLMLHYRELGAKRLSRVISRSPQAIHARAKALGLSDRASWTKLEDITIQLMYRVAHISALTRSLKGRTVGSVYARAWRLGLSKERGDW